ncbi:AT-rich interactive domain-containing protein 4A isoform X2 [Phycodurus eques]|uniref:AT-rich interactive domain-containing protein 4A isoform X2 n=1 Tax=Phycodurus eques TaxID=693459 RepID=UPI002ACD2EAA|nr:AT-rich interactive domain-containing protein 4A isoform X2 [Phycodurus eques]
MKAADEPAYLTVGTDVSAKYRGAFCEAKIKIVKRLVKVKVTLKGDSTSQVVHDDQVKGALRVGSTVEVKTSEGVCGEAVIGKLTDASLYTVVFDDGDEKTLRRSSLCLKGERHFAESETLDQLPLTNPEHFGTPVIGKKSNRGRRSSQAVADEENESSSSEDDEDERGRLNDELLGKVCSIKKEDQPSSWFLALVVSPSCNDELVVKKDQCLVRSFSDSKFCTVARRNVHPLNSISINKSELSNTRGFEAAQRFARRREVPEAWKMDMSQILDSSSSDEEVDDEEEEEEEKASEDDDVDEEEKRKKLIKEEPEEEPDPEERDHFLQQLYKFMEDRGTPINKPPVLGYKDLNLFKLFRLVFQHGGCRKIESGTVWKQIYMDLGIPILNSAASYNVKTAYKKYLFGFEEYCRSACITFRTVHHNNPRAPKLHTIPRSTGPEFASAALKGEAEGAAASAESESESDKDELKDRQASPRGRRRCGAAAAKTEAPNKGGDDNGDARRSSRRRPDGSDRGSEEDEDDEEEEEEEDDEFEERERRLGARSEDEEEEEEEEEEEDSDAVTGTKVRVKYGRGKTQKIYEAHIKKTDTDNGEPFYLVHYYGWNVRYDEWVKADRIIWPADKGTRKRTRKKNKEEADKEEDKVRAPPTPPKPAGAKRGRPQIRTPPGRKTPGGEGRSNGKSVRTETPPDMANGDNSSRIRRTRRTSGMYDSDRASNEDSGNSTVDSESEEPPDKKLSPWRGRPEKEEEESSSEAKEGEPGEPIVTATGRRPEDTARVADPSEETEDPAPETEDEVGGEREVVAKTEKVSPPSSPGVASPQPDEPQEAPPAPSVDPKTPPLSPPAVKVHNCETPPKISSPPTALSPEPPPTPPAQSVPKRADEPMVVLRCLPPPRHRPEPPVSAPAPTPASAAAPSDTDSASEEEEEKPELKLSPDRKQEEDTPTSPKSLASPTKVGSAVSPESLPSPLRGAEAERKSHRAARADEVRGQVDEESKERPKEEVGTPPRAQEALGPAPGEEPQMGAEALLCHEVDLDDPDDKDKPAPSTEPLLLIVRERPPRPPSPRRPLLPVLPDAVSCHAPCPEELRSAGRDLGMEEEVVAGGGDEEEEEEEEEEDDDDDARSRPDVDASQEARGQKRLAECHTSPSSKKHKRNHKRAGGTPKNGTGHSSDSEDQTRLSSSSKSNKSRCPAATSPQAKEKHGAAYKWTFQLDALDSMSSSERISFLQDKLQEIRKYYMSLKSEVASIDRRRKRLKKKEREGKTLPPRVGAPAKCVVSFPSASNTAASTSSGSSDTAMSPSSASPAQSAVAVECR